MTTDTDNPPKVDFLESPELIVLRRGIFALFYLTLFGLLGYLIIVLVKGAWNDLNGGTWLAAIATSQFRAVVIIPVSAVVSFALVWAFSVVQGAIEVKLGGLEFKGASSHIIFWLIVFLGLVVAVNTAWVS